MNQDKPNPRRRWPRWTLRALLLLFIPLSAVLAYYGHLHRQRQLAIEAIQSMCDKGVDANIGEKGQVRTLYFKNANVTDADLDAYTSAFNGHGPAQWEAIEILRLNGSKVSAAARQRFCEAVPGCQIVP